jgi:RNA polymerase sigma factor (sigma-70 family)
MKKGFWNKSGRSPVDEKRTALFEETLLPHLDAAYNLARWLTGNDQDAQDVVQETYLRALNAFDSFQRGREGRPWLLKIVRNTCYTWMRENRKPGATTFSDSISQDISSSDPDPEVTLLRETDAKTVRQALEGVQLEYREALVLRELEGLSYKEIAELLEIPLGTVMSRLSRGRKELWRLLNERT